MTPGLKILNVEPCQRPGIPPDVLEVAYRTDLDDWALVLPPATGQRWAVVLHGHGSDATQIFTRPDVKAAWLPPLLDHGLGIVSPNLRGNAWMSPAARHDLKELLTWLRAEHGAAQFVFFSGSMGGTGSLIYACFHPEEVAALAACCPAVDLNSYVKWCQEPGRRPVAAQIGEAILAAYADNMGDLEDASALRRVERLQGFPLAIAHGDADDIIPVNQSRKLAALIQDRPDFLYREIPGGDHDCLCHDAALLEWILARVNTPTGRCGAPAPYFSTPPQLNAE